MHTQARRKLGAGILTAGCLVIGVGASSAGTSGAGGVLSGNQFAAPITAPITACGNATAVLGKAKAHCKGNATANSAAGFGTTSGAGGVLSGNQFAGGVTAPVTVCGDATAVLGKAKAHCKGNATANSGSGFGSGSAFKTSGTGGVLSGNQVSLPITVPVTICGNGTAILGIATAHCKGNATANSGSGSGSGARTSGAGGVLSGNQLFAPITIPVVVCGNATAVLGLAAAHCKGNATANSGSGSGSGAKTSGAGGVLSGNQLFAPITAPITACGNATAILGLAKALCSGNATAGAGSRSGSGSGAKTSGAGGDLSGNQISVPVTVPVTVCGNGTAILGIANAHCGGNATAGGGPTAGPGTTDGSGGVGSGNQVNLPITIPVTVCGNATAVLGTAKAACKGNSNVPGGGPSAGPGGATDGSGGIGSGNQFGDPVTIPIAVCGNATAVLGKAKAHCQEGGSPSEPPTPTPSPTPSGGSTGSTDLGSGANTPHAAVQGSGLSSVGNTLAMTGTIVGGLAALALVLLLAGTTMQLSARRSRRSI